MQLMGFPNFITPRIFFQSVVWFLWILVYEHFAYECDYDSFQYFGKLDIDWYAFHLPFVDFTAKGIALKREIN